MSQDSLNDQLRAESHRKRRKRTSKNLEEVNETTRNVAAERVALQDVPYRGTATQARIPSSGNSNSLELSDERKSKPRRTRKRASRQNVDANEEGEHSIERRGHRRPHKPRINRSVSEEVLDIQREMDEAQLQGIRRLPNASMKTQVKEGSDPMLPVQRMENNHNSTLPKGAGESRRQKQKRNKSKQRLSRLQNTSAEEENYQGDLDDEASFCGGFKVDKEDIVIEESSAPKVPVTITTATSPSLLPSQPLDVLFIERKDGGFKKEHKDKVAQSEIASREPPVPIQREPTTSDFAMSTHRAFKVFALFCHGLLAGFALCQCLFVYSLSSHSGGSDNFLQNYYRLSQPIGSVYYILLAVCAVSVFDSYGMVKSKSGFCHGILTSPTRTLSLIVYVLALIFTLSIAMIDDRISLYHIDSTLWEKEKEKEDLIDDWKIINLMRVLGSVLGWILLVLQPSKDGVEESLFDDRVNGEVAVPNKTTLGCNVGQHVGYKDISP